MDLIASWVRDLTILVISRSTAIWLLVVFTSRKYTECKYGGPLGHRPGRVKQTYEILSLNFTSRFSLFATAHPYFSPIMFAPLPSSLKSHTVNDYLVNNLSSLSHSEEREEDLEDLKLPVYRFEILKVGSGNNGNGNGGSIRCKNSPSRHIVTLQIYC